MSNRIPKIEELKQMYWQEKKNQSQIAQELGCSQGTISNRMKRLGIKPRNNQEIASIKYPIIKKLDNEEFQVLVGSLLGDGSLQINKEGINARFTEHKKIGDVEYLKWKAKVLTRFYPRIAFNQSQRVFALWTKVHPKLTEFRKHWYPNGRKEVNFGDLERLDALGLAVWYMDDGSYNFRGDTCALYTESFELMENKALKLYFERKWAISPRICCKRKSRNNWATKETYFLLFNVRDSTKFLEVVSPFVHSCMARKLKITRVEDHRKYLKKLAMKRRERYHNDANYRKKRLANVWQKRKQSMIKRGVYEKYLEKCRSHDRWRWKLDQDYRERRLERHKKWCQKAKKINKKQSKLQEIEPEKLHELGAEPQEKEKNE